MSEQSLPLPGPTGDKVDDNDNDDEPPHGLKLTSSIAMTSPVTEAVFATKATCKNMLGPLSLHDSVYIDCKISYMKS